MVTVSRTKQHASQRSSSSIPLFLLLRICIVLVGLTGVVDGSCVMQGYCGKFSETGGLTCVANQTTSTPQLLDNTEAQATMERLCPHLALEPVCCDSQQLMALSTQLSQASAILTRCPACYDNFIKMWCEFTCSPRQNEFLEVLEVNDVPEKGLEYVNHVRYNLSEQFAGALFDSCKNVKLGASNALNAMCISTANEKCERANWFKFMGTKSLPNGIPMNINFNVKDGIGAMNISTTPCDMSPRFGQDRCRPSDCPLVRSSHDFFPQDSGTKEACSLIGVDCHTWYLVFAAIVFVCIIGCVLVAHWCKDENEEPTMDYRGVDTNRGAIGSIAHWIEKQIKINCSMYGEFMSQHRLLVLLFGVFICMVSCCGLAFMKLTADPEELWSAPNSQARLEKRQFDHHFGPFYRVQTVIMYPKPLPVPPVLDVTSGSVIENGKGLGPVFQKDFLLEVFKVVSWIHGVKVVHDGQLVSFEDLCHRPLGPLSACLVHSPADYFQNNVSLLDLEVVKEATGIKGPSGEVFYDYDDPPSITVDFHTHLSECIGNPLSVQTSLGKSCLGSYGGPTYPQLVFGGSPSNYSESTAIMITVLVNGRVQKKKAMAWEEKLIEKLKEYKHGDIQMSFMAERSITDEITRESESDGWVIMIACTLMCCYILFALGIYIVENNSLFSLLVHSKILVGIVGMFSLFFSVISSIGVFSLYGMTVPQSALVVQFFVILVVGSNRMFTAIHTYQRLATNPEEPVSELMYRICGEVLPGMLMSTVAESLCFFIGALQPVPAVRSFCLVAALASVFEFIFHCTIFMPMLVSDINREKKGKPEGFCLGECTESDMPETDSVRIFFEMLANWILRPIPASIILIFGVGVAILSTLVFTSIRLGLDQKMAVPEDSYVYLHFKNMDRYLNVGPPVYFVVSMDKLDLMNQTDQNRLCTVGGCNDNSLGSILHQATNNPTQTFVTGEVYNWVDQYLEWLSSTSECCKILPTNSSAISYCSTNQYTAEQSRSRQCQLCDIGEPLTGRPTRSAFYKHLDQFMDDIPNARCIKGGRGAFKNAIYRSPRGIVESAHFMTYHTPLRNATDFITAMEGARMVARKIEHVLGDSVKVYPYSSYYIFHDQYITLRRTAAFQLVFSITAIFSSICLLSGLDPYSAMFCAMASFVHLLAQVLLMGVWNVEFNPITAVNLIFGVGTSMEFFVPIVNAFSQSLKPTRTERAKECLINAGPTVFSGITMTMLVGTMVLVAAHSQFFRVFYFRMFLGISISGAFYGLLCLPVALMICGPPVKRWRYIEQLKKESDMLDNRDQMRENISTALSATASLYKCQLDSLNPLLSHDPEETTASSPARVNLCLD